MEDEPVDLNAAHLATDPDEQYSDPWGVEYLAHERIYSLWSTAVTDAEEARWRSRRLKKCLAELGETDLARMADDLCNQMYTLAVRARLRRQKRLKPDHCSRLELALKQQKTKP